jgi:PAS domain S-box-containing protein
VTSTDDMGLAAARLSSINAVFGLSLVLTQASSPSQAMRLLTTAVPSIAPGHTAAAWHPSTSGLYYERAPEQALSAMTRLIGPGRLDLDGVASCWAIPVTSPLRREPIFLIITGQEDPSEEETFLLSVLAQMCGTVIANHELRAEADLRERADRERDIAQARAAELAASEARQRSVLEAALDAVISIDQRGQVTYVNSAFERTFGYRSEDVIGREIAEMIVPPSLRERHRRGFTRYLVTMEPRILDQRIELAAMRADGTEFPAEVTVTRTGVPGEPGFTAYVRDITERRHAEQELMASRAPGHRVGRGEAASYP